VSKYKELFDKCAGEINKFWTPALSEKLKADQLNLINEAEAEAERCWDVDFDKFREALRKFYKLHKEVVD
jgi:hypothetical protein